jgi:UDP-2,4-diacetamido-2,4,6-trideoxy-beta-L-altropyranose hydrolase
MPNLLLIRADANVSIATGHVMRCLALSQAWQDAGGSAMFVMGDSTVPLEQKLRFEKIEVVRFQSVLGSPEDAAQTATLAREYQPDWVVVDGYHFGADYQRSLTGAGNRLLFVDDYGHAEHYSSDLVLNQNAHASERLYTNHSPHTKLLLGPHYAMLRREFQAWLDWQRTIPAIGCKVLVTMGGSDPDNVTDRILQAIEQVNVEHLQVCIVVGNSNPHTHSLHERVSKSTRDVHIVQNPPNMAELMTWADVAIAGAGATCWEMCFLGLPALLVDLAPNQTPIAQTLDSMSVAIHVASGGDANPTKIANKLNWLLQSKDVRQKMSVAGRKLVDGRGATNVVRSMRDYEAMISGRRFLK